MDQRRSPLRQRKSKAEDSEPGTWDCSVCTYRNRAEAFKCAMCDVRKGTSTRKPRVSAQIVAQQIAQQFAPPPPKLQKATNLRKISLGSHKKGSISSNRPRLKNVDRNSAQQMEITVGNVTVVITDYKLLPVKDRGLSPPLSPAESTEEDLETDDSKDSISSADVKSSLSEIASRA